MEKASILNTMLRYKCSNCLHVSAEAVRLPPIVFFAKYSRYFILSSPPWRGLCDSIHEECNAAVTLLEGDTLHQALCTREVFKSLLARSVSWMHKDCAHFIVLNLMVLITFGAECKLQKLVTYFQSPHVKIMWQNNKNTKYHVRYWYSYVRVSVLIIKISETSSE
jgi:hypothetical protein